MTRSGALLAIWLLGAALGCASREPLPPTLSGEPISRADAEAAEAAYETGVARFEAGAYATALPEFTRIVEEYPSSRYGGLALFWQGRTLYQLGRDAEAIPALDRYLQLAPTVPHREHAALLLANSHYGVRAFDAAVISALLVDRASPERLDDFLGLSRDLLKYLSRPAIEGVSGRKPARNFLAPFYLQSARWAFAAGDTLRGRDLARQVVAYPEVPAELLAEARGLVGADAAPVATQPRLGFIATTEGRFADVTEQIRRGIELALEDVNAGRAVPVELLVRATTSDPDSTVDVIRALARIDRVEAILGPMISEMAIPAGRAAAEEGVTLVSPTATDARLLDIGPHVYTVNALDGAIGHTLGTYAVRTLEKRRFAILAVDNPYGRVQAEAFAAAVEAAGAQVVSRHDYPPGATQFTSHLGDVMRGRADAVFIATKNAGEALRILNQMAFYELYSVTPLGTDAWNDQAFLRDGRRLARGYFADTFSRDPRVTSWQAFADRYTARYGEPPSSLISAWGYDAARLALEHLSPGGTARAGQLPTAAGGADTSYRGASALFRLGAQGARRAVVIHRFERGAPVALDW